MDEMIQRVSIQEICTKSASDRSTHLGGFFGLAHRDSSAGFAMLLKATPSCTFCQVRHDTTSFPYTFERPCSFFLSVLNVVLQSNLEGQDNVCFFEVENKKSFQLRLCFRSSSRESLMYFLNWRKVQNPYSSDPTYLRLLE